MKKQLITLVAMILLLASCSKAGAEADIEAPDVSLPPVVLLTPTPSPTPTPTPTPIPTPEPTPYAGPFNPLSGLPVSDELATKRPFAVVINNRKIALPQLGTSKADVLIEVPVEGAYTRMVAVFQDITDAGNIGSVRSSRPYLIDIAQSFDSIFIFAGGSNDAYVQLKSRKIDRFDGVNGPGSGMFFRDANRRKSMGYEHSLLTSSSKIAEYIDKQGYRLEHEDSYVPPFKFEDGHKISGSAATKITVKFNSSKSTSFEYNKDDTLYYSSQQGGKFVDGNTGDQLTFANLIVIKTAIKTIDKDGRLSVDLKSGGDGYLAIGGQYVPVKWSKSSNSAPFVFKDEKGAEITLRPGHTYIGIISTSASAEFSEE